MSNSILNAGINIFGTVSKNLYDGVLRIHSKETLIIDHIDAVIYLEARGKMSGVKNRIVSFQIDTKRTVQKDESYKIPFTFNLPDGYIDSYSGKNVSISYNCEAKIHVNEEDLEKLDRSVFTKVKSFFTSDYATKVSTYFNKFNKEENYKISREHSDLKLAYNFISLLFTTLIVSVLFLIALLSLKFELHAIHGLIFIASVALVSYIQFEIKKKKIGDISLKTFNSDEGFICAVKPARNFSLTKAEIYYQIIEKVVDNRGTSSSTYTKTIFKSPIKPLKSKGSSEVEFQFPENKSWSSMEFEDASIYWEIVIKGKHSGVSEVMKCTIEAYKN